MLLGRRRRRVCTEEGVSIEGESGRERGKQVRILQRIW